MAGHEEGHEEKVVAESEKGPRHYGLVSEASEASTAEAAADSESGPTVFAEGGVAKVIRGPDREGVHPADARAHTERRHR